MFFLAHLTVVSQQSLFAKCLKNVGFFYSFANTFNSTFEIDYEQKAGTEKNLGN